MEIISGAVIVMDTDIVNELGVHIRIVLGRRAAIWSVALVAAPLLVASDKRQAEEYS
jgi:hypothetical protein